MCVCVWNMAVHVSGRVTILGLLVGGENDATNGEKKDDRPCSSRVVSLWSCRAASGWCYLLSRCQRTTRSSAHLAVDEASITTKHMASLVQLYILCSSSPAIRPFFVHHKPVSVRSLFRGTTVFADKTLLKSKTPQGIITSSKAHLHEKPTSANTTTNPAVVHFRVLRLLLPPPPPSYSLSSAPTPRRLIPNVVYLAPVPQQVAAARKGRATAAWVGALPPTGVLVEAGADARKGVPVRSRRWRVGGLGVGGVDEGGMERHWWWVEAGVGAGGSSGSSSSDSARYTRCGIVFFVLAQHVSERLGVVGRACQIEVDKGIP